jgi:hypothetical protein
MWVQNALDSPAPLRDVVGRLGWWARGGPGARGALRGGWPGGGRASGSPAGGNPAAPAPGPVSSRRTQKVAAATPSASVPGPRAAGSGHPRSCQPASPPPMPAIRSCCGHSATSTVALPPNLPSQPAGRRLGRVQARGCPAPGRPWSRAPDPVCASGADPLEGWGRPAHRRRPPARGLRTRQRCWLPAGPPAVRSPPHRPPPAR